MDFLKSIGGKITTGLVVLAVLAVAISWWQTDAVTRHSILVITGKLLCWGIIVLLLPWGCYAVIGWVARYDRNSAGAMLVFVFTIIEAVGLAWLFDWSVHGTLQWVTFIAAVVAAAVYNLFTCDWIAEKVA